MAEGEAGMDDCVYICSLKTKTNVSIHMTLLKVIFIQMLQIHLLRNIQFSPSQYTCIDEIYACIYTYTYIVNILGEEDVYFLCKMFISEHFQKLNKKENVGKKLTDV